MKKTESMKWPKYTKSDPTKKSSQALISERDFLLKKARIAWTSLENRVFSSSEAID